MKLLAVAAGASDALSSLLFRQNAFFQAFLAIVVICACTRVISGYRFSKIKNGRDSGIAPPTLPHWIPWLRHGLNMGWSAKGYIAQCLNEYGGETPFFIDGAGEKILILLNPKHVKHVLRSVHECDPNPFVHEKIMHQLMGSPHAAIDYYKSPESTLDHDQMVQVRQLSSGSALPALDKRTFDVLMRNLSGSFGPTAKNGWTAIPDLYAFFEDCVTRTIIEVLFGSNIVKTYPTFAADMWRFIEDTDLFLTGLPRFLNAKAYATRARLLKHLRNLSREHDILNTQNALNGEWHPIAGSILVQEREKMYAALPGHDHEARAAQNLGILYATTGVIVPVSFWLCYETARTPSLQRRVNSELEANRDPRSRRHDFSQLSATSFLQSLHAETCRKYGVTIPARRVVAPSFALDEKYVVPQGTTIIMPSKYAGQYTPGWAAIRHSLIEKPLEQFWPERFLVNKEVEKERFSDAGLVGSWTSFGGGAHHCPGRFWARNIGMVMLAVFFGDYEVQIDDVEGARQLDPVWFESAYGTARPKGKIAARIRRRELQKGQ
ncbi:hypothetical protein OPT61_g8224 [Boeremia exigua]|uniref:Uncharacterized protein n=1 Tax=Boeremia exigua TaxID=749465 RepID=A0ACC2HZ69_9PLEO|nr:hypothetical protein OPT61_g8224 [Boeremia exigua]